MIGGERGASTWAGRETHAQAHLGQYRARDDVTGRRAPARRHRSVGGLARAAHGSTGGGAGREGKEGKVGLAFWSARLSRQLRYLAELLNLSDTRPEQGGCDERSYPYPAPVTCCIRRDRRRPARRSVVPAFLPVPDLPADQEAA